MSLKVRQLSNSKKKDLKPFFLVPFTYPDKT